MKKQLSKRKSIFSVISVLLIALLALSFAACSNGSQGEASSGDNQTQPESTGAVSEIINLGALNGPTGMGAVKLMDMTDKYNVEIYQAPTDAVSKLISGDIDVACLPSNMAAVLYNKTGGDVVSVSPMVMGVLYIMGNNVEVTQISDLKGKTIVSSGQGGTPEYVLQKILSDAGLTIYEDVDVQWLGSHADVNAKLLSEEGTIAMVPEPFVSVASSKGQGSVSVLFDINELWKESTGEELPMGVLVAKREFAENRSGDLDILLADLEASISEVNSSSDDILSELVEKGFFAEPTIAGMAIPNCHLTLYTGNNREAGNEIISTFNEILFEMDSASVGGTLPGEDMYLK